MESFMESVQIEMSEGPAGGTGFAINHDATEPAQDKTPEKGPDMDLAIRHLAIAYFFQLGLQQKEISDRLDLPKAES